MINLTPFIRTHCFVINGLKWNAFKLMGGCRLEISVIGFYTNSENTSCSPEIEVEHFFARVSLFHFTFRGLLKWTQNHLCDYNKTCGFSKMKGTIEKTFYVMKMSGFVLGYKN